MKIGDIVSPITDVQAHGLFRCVRAGDEGVVVGVSISCAYVAVKFPEYRRPVDMMAIELTHVHRS